MEFVLGTVLIMAAMALLGVARYVVTRCEQSSWIRNFAGTETMALIITTLSAFGFVFLCTGLASHQSNLGYAEFGAAIGVIALSAVSVSRVFRRRAAKPAPGAASPTQRVMV